VGFVFQFLQPDSPSLTRARERGSWSPTRHPSRLPVGTRPTRRTLVGLAGATSDSTSLPCAAAGGERQQRVAIARALAKLARQCLLVRTSPTGAAATS
jgi:predicted ABC-type transport system involved in lysophospholipase L1 biosynthesis ATPase subunit